MSTLVENLFSIDSKALFWTAVGASIGACLGYLIRQPSSPAPPSRSSSARSSSQDEPPLERFEGNYKMVLVINTSLKMTPGKIAAQCGHATLGAYLMGVQRDPLTVRRWESLGQAKVALKGTSTEELDRLEAMAAQAGLSRCLIQDQGRTQIPEGSKTVLAIGPALVEDIDKLTGRLKLY